MAHRVLGQASLADALVSPKAGTNTRLRRIAELVDWSGFAVRLADLHASGVGRPSWPPLLMFRCLLLQQWYGLSDPGLEEALSDRLSFRRFVGLSADEGTPDHSTLSRVRKALRETGCDAALMDEIARQLDGLGLVVRSGTLLDATLVEAQVRRPSLKEDAGAKSPHDPQAGWTRKGGRSHFGYKAHVAVDEGSGLIRRAILTAAYVNESLVADALICGDERAVYADKAYENKHRRTRLKAQGIKDRILHRSHKNQACLPPWQARRNRLISPIRAAVERVFGTLKRSYGYTHVRYRGLCANATQLRLLVLAYNLRRADRLMITPAT
jgi:IS5 family transposase